jgi:hypothetical protein
MPKCVKNDEINAPNIPNPPTIIPKSIQMNMFIAQIVPNLPKSAQKYSHR